MGGCKRLRAVYLVVVAWFVGFTQAFGVTITSDVADAGIKLVESTGVYSVQDAGSTEAHLGNRATTSQLRVLVIPFQLPAKESDERVDPDTAGFSFTLAGRDTGSFGVDLYGLGYRSAATVVTNDYLIDSATLLQETIFNGASLNGSRISTSVAGAESLANWITAQYDAGAVGGNFVFLQLRADDNVKTNTIDSFKIDMADHSDDALRPKLQIEMIKKPVFGTTIIISALRDLWLRYRS